MASSSAKPESAFAGHHYQDEMGGNPTHARLLISEAEAEAGLMDGSSVAAMESRSGARIRLSRPGPGHRVALVSGLFPQVMDAAELILHKILLCQSDQAIDAQATLVLVVPDACCDALIGKGGAVLKSLAQESNAGITISPYDICNGLQDRLVTITGHLDNQLQAIFLILSELLDNVHYSCSSAGDNFSIFLSSPVGCEDGGPNEHTGRYHSRPNMPMRSPDNSKDAQESFSIAAPDEHVGADTEVTGASIGTSANVDLIVTSANVDLIAGSHSRRAETKDAMKLDPYYLHLVDNFIEAIAPDVKAKSLYDHADYQIAYKQQTIEYAESALKRYNCGANKTASYELVKGICSCGIKEPEGLYGHVNFTAKNGLDSKVEFFFAELFWDSKEEIFNTTSVVSLEEDDRVGGCHGTEVSDYCDGPNVCVDPQHCYACGADLKHPVDGRLYEIGHKVLNGCYGYDP